MKLKAKKNKKRPFDPNAFLSKVNGGRTVATYRKNQIAYRQGDPADSVFYLQAGKAKVTVISAQGREAVTAMLGEGDFFGEGCLGGQVFRLATVTALSPRSVMRTKAFSVHSRARALSLPLTSVAKGRKTAIVRHFGNGSTQPFPAGRGD